MQKAKHNVIQYYQLQSGSMATTMKRDKSYSAVISQIAVDICNAMFWNKIEKKYWKFCSYDIFSPVVRIEILLML